MVEFKNSNQYGKLDEARLLEFEKSLGCTLPEEYRTYLMAHNGGEPEPHDFDFEGDTSGVCVMYGLHEGPSWARLDSAWQVYSGRIPSEWMSIGSDPGGNEVCIGLVGDRRGRIVFWDHESGKLSDLAASFTEFLESLYEWVDPDEHSFLRICRTHDLEEVQRIIDSGLDLDALDDYGRSLIEYAVMYGHLDMVKQLSNAGASFRNCRQCAEDRDNRELLRFLDEAGG